MGRRPSLARHPSTAPKPPSFIEKSPILDKLSTWSSNHLNFYRVHMLFFTIVPLITSAIFYASNGKNHIAYVDSLFMVVSAMTVTGLNSVLLADLTLWQQVILFLMMTLGSSTSVSLITILIRRQFFRRKFQYMVQNSAEARHRVNEISAEEAAAHKNSRNPFHAKRPIVYPTIAELSSVDKARNKEKRKKKEKLRADMVRRLDVPVRVNQMNVGGWLRDGQGEPEADRTEGEFLPGPLTSEPMEERNESALDDEDDSDEDGDLRVDRGEPTFPVTRPPGESKASVQIDESSKPDRHLHVRRSIDLGTHPEIIEHRRSMDFGHHADSVPTPSSPVAKHFPRSRTVEFHDESTDLRFRKHRTIAAGDHHHSSGTQQPRRMSHSNLRDPHSQRTFTRTATRQTTATDLALHSGFGGFPNPLVAAADFVRERLGPTLERHVTMSVPRTTTIQSVHTVGGDKSAKAVSYITFDAVVGRNSKFHGLTTAQQEELGGVEYRALTVLLRIVASYWFFSQMICVLIIAPYLTKSKKYAPVFADPPLNPTWFTFFQVWSAWSNNGMSLVDASMVPFQSAFPLIFVMAFLILGGNTAFPVFLRFVIWVVSKAVPKHSRVKETLQFLLDHPRRCFIYLFPSHQTWFLFFVLIVLNSIDWVSFLVLDIGNAEIEKIPVGTRIVDGLLQAFAVRAAGFATVTLSNVAPALQLLYVVMMYIAVYPIAVSIRSTNVYEEKSMGVFDDDDNSEEFEAGFEKQKNHSPGQYIAYHARKQLAFDMWWLVLALWLICIIERDSISDVETPWITIFTLIFEVCSSYGTVGLSLGTPTKNTSLAGTLRTLSKLVLIAVMIRGRHRGLPIAIDRAVLLPSDLVKHGDDTAQSFAETPPTYGREDDQTDAQSTRGGLAAVEPLTDEERVRQGSTSLHDGAGGIELDERTEKDEAQRNSPVGQESNSSKEL